MLAGYVQDSLTGEKLIGATLFLPQNGAFSITNDYGFFSVNAGNKGGVEVEVSYLSYEKRIFRFFMTGDTTVILDLQPAANQLSTVEVKVFRPGNAPPKTEGSIVQLSQKEVKQLPKLLGEADALRTLQLLPGVQGGAEGSSSLYVRGGSPDQNLILLDDVPLYFANHLGGFVSVIDANAINSIKLYKGGFPARFAGRLSSVLDIRLKDGGTDQWEKLFSIGVLSSRLSLSGPLVKGKVTMLATLRRSNLDLPTRLASLVRSGQEFSAGFYFFDGTLKINYQISPRDRVHFSFYAGEDRLFIAQNQENEFQGELYTLNSRTKNNWGNRAAALRWSHLYSERFFANYVLSWSRFSYFNGLNAKQTPQDPESLPRQVISELTSGIDDLNLRLHHEVHGKILFRFGLLASVSSFEQPGIYLLQRKENGQQIEQTEGGSIKGGQSAGAYLEVEPVRSGNFTVNAGGHAGFFFTDGKAFPTLQPRLAANCHLGSGFSINSSYARMVQNLHLLSNSGAGLPTDLWLPATKAVRPSASDQLSMGAQWEKQGFSVEADVFHKWLRGLIEFRQGASFFAGGGDWQNKVETGGRGRVYGVELSVKKKMEKLNAWVAYTWSKNTRTFNNLNEGEPFPYKFDRPHVLDIVAIWEPNPRFNMSMTWAFESGTAITLANARYELETWDVNPNSLRYEIEFGPHDAQLFNKRNNYRLPNYHRMDINFNFIKTYKKKGKERTRTLSTGVYNLYNKLNPYFLFFDQNEEGKVRLYQFTLFPALPYLSYEVKW